MADTSIKQASSPLRRARDRRGLGRERVAGQLDPPISSKTLERWEKPGARVPLWRLEQLAALYGLRIETLARSIKAAA
jgi:DNA-binding XRE family transcriptional regulator